MRAIFFSPPPISYLNVCMTSTLPPVFSLNGFSTLKFVQPSPQIMFELQPSLRFHVSIVFISLTPALSIIFILIYLSTRSVVHAIPRIVTWRSPLVKKFVNTNLPVSTLPRLPCLFLVLITRVAYLHHHSSRELFTPNRFRCFLVRRYTSSVGPKQMYWHTSLRWVIATSRC